MRTIAGLIATGVLLLLLVLWLRPDAGPDTPADGLRVASLLGDPQLPEGFARATRPGAISLPADHGPHPRFQSEWWYFTGHLDEVADAASPNGDRRFGFQLTFFRFATVAEPLQRESAWASNQLYMAHFAVTEIGPRRHRVAERFSRGAAGLAGAQAEPFEVWLDDWRAVSLGDSFLPLRLDARDGDLRLALRVEPGKPPVLQGEDGLSRKGPEPGNASYYYSYTRLPVQGEISLDGETVAVGGEAWLDREWSSSSLGSGVQGWDWFGLQLDDGRELMLYSLRDESGNPTGFSAATLVAADGTAEHFSVDAFELAPQRRWRSLDTGVSWPVDWHLRLPSAGLELDVRALVDDQEQRVAVLYWEGAVEVLDPSAGGRIGRGYLEMTGYAER